MKQILQFGLDFSISNKIICGYCYCPLFLQVGKKLGANLRNGINIVKRGPTVSKREGKSATN